MARLQSWLDRKSVFAKAQKATLRPAITVEQLEPRVLLSGAATRQLAPAQTTELIDGLYQTLENRTPQSVEVAAWTGAMDQGATPATVAAGFLYSPEFETRIINEEYKLLGRTPEPGIAPAWQSVIHSAGTYQVMTIALLASPEYYAIRGSTAQHWVTALYRDVLGRAPDGAGEQAWMADLQQGVPRQAVAAGFVNSPEAQRLLIEDGYETLLGRAAEHQGVDAWTAALAGGLTAEQFVAQIVGSPEFTRLLDAGLFPRPSMAPPNLAVDPLTHPGGTLTGAAQSAVSFLDPTISATEGQTFNGVVDMFEPMDGLTDPANYTASISWGDSQVSGGVVASDSQTGGLQVSGSHTYADEGSYAIQITLQDSAGNTSVLSDSAQVGDAALSSQGTVLTSEPGQTFSDVVGTFTDANAAAPSSDFQATIGWGDGGVSTGTVGGSGGFFTVNGQHTFIQAGAYTITVSIQDVGGSRTSFTTTIEVGSNYPNNAGLLGKDPSINATEGAAFSGAVGTFTDSDGNTNPALYSASIVWGDGATTTGTVSGSGGSTGFTVSGTHTYAEEGSDAVTVSITDTDGAHFNVNSTAIVADAALTPTAGSGLNPTSGSAYTATWATFTDADPNGTVSDYTATIAWGDGTVSAGTVATNTGGGFKVTATHTFPQGGTLSAIVTVSDAGGASSSVTDTVTVKGLVPTGVNLSAVAGSALNSSTALATFSDTSGGHGLTYTASINWGDGNTGSGSITGTGPYTVRSGHTYAQQGYYPITVSIASHPNNLSATVVSNINVAHATLTVTNQVPSSSSTLGYSGNVATFSDSDGDQGASHFTAYINWGDGQTSRGQITGTGNFTVVGSHNYSQAGTYTVTTSISDVVDGTTGTASGNMTISLSGPLTLTPTSNLTGTEGTALTNLVVGTFTDSDGNTNSSAYTATILWGDGASSTGTVTRQGSSFQIAGTHTYAEEGTMPLSITVSDTDTASTQAATSLVVNDAALTPTAQSVSATAGRPLSAALVAKFTDGDSGGVVTDYTALVNWGDNSPPTAGAIATATGGGFQVSGGHLYATANTYTATVTITDAGGASTTATDTVTVSAPTQTLTASAVSATEGASYSANVAVLTPQSGHMSDSYVATIGWGDGTVAYATLTANGSTYNVSGTHTYGDESSTNNPETLTVTALDQTTGQISVATATVTVADAALTPTAQAITAWTNQTTGTITVATFTDANPGSRAADFTAQIAWGDGSTTAGTVVANGSSFAVQGSHTYTATGSPTVQTTITDIGASTASASANATVANKTTSINATEGATFSGTVATFSGNVANALSATIVWGDGSSSSGTISGNSSSYSVSGTHVYAEEGVDNMTVTVQLSPSGQATASGPAVVADAGLSATANAQTGWLGQPLGLVAGTGTSPVNLASFSDADSAGTVVDYTANINWGDGTSSAGSIVVNGSSFNAQGNHAYVSPGAYTVSTTITDAGGSTVNVQATATIGIREGQQYDAVLTLSLPDPVTTAPPASYTATITWGDTTSSNAIATPVYTYSGGVLSGSLLVTATHVYAASGTYTVSATATDPATNASSTGSQSLTVGDALLNSVPQTLTAVASNSTGTVTVAQVEDTNGSAAASQLSASINWGDGSATTSGTVAAASGGLFSVQGSHTYSSTGPYTIQTTVTDTGGQSVTVSSPVNVVSAWTVLGTVQGARGSDPDRANLIPLGEATVDLNQGALRLSHALDFDQSPGTDVGNSPALDYNSASVNVRPIIQLQLQSDPNTGHSAATNIAVQLTFNGNQQSTVNFPITSYQAGAMYLVAVQAANAVTATGAYSWSAAITITRSDNSTVNASASGTAYVVVRDSSKYGAGWGIDGISQLFTVSGGILFVTGAGDVRFFSGSGPNYTSPPEDFGSLVLSGGVYTYTAKNQVKQNFNSNGFLTSLAYPSGLQISYSYDSQNRLTQVQTPDGATATLSYDPTSGLLKTITEPGSRTVSLQEDSNGNITQITDVDSTTRTLSYDSNHHLTGDQWSPLNAAFTFNSNGLLTQVNRGLGTTYTITAAAAAGLSSASTGQPFASVTDGLSHTTQYLLDTRGRLLEKIRPDSTTYLYQLNAAGDSLVSVDPLGRVTADGYNSSGDLTKITYPDGTVALYQYDSTFHEVTQTTNGVGEVTSNTYNSTTGLLATSTDALGFVTNYSWSSGRLQSQTDPLGHVMLYRYDGDLRQVAQIDSLGKWSQTGYDSNGDIASTTDALGWTSLTSYNGRGELVQSTDPNGDVTSQQYNAYGQMTGDTNARGFSESTTYDQRGLATSKTDYLGNSTTMGYDAATNMTSSTDANGNQTSFQFDSDNRQTAVTDPMGNQTQTQYDSADNVTATIDANGNTTHNYFDLLNRKMLTVDPLGHNQFSVYYPCCPGGELLATVNAIGAVSRQLYDADHRQVEAIDPLGHISVSGYDTDSNLIQSTDARGMVSHFLFDGDNRQTAAIDPDGNVSRTVYNADGLTVQTIDGNGHSTSFSFDAVNRQNSVTDADSNRSQTVYDVAGNVWESIDANGNVTVTTLDADNRSIAVKDGAGKVSKTVYDAAGNTIATIDQNGAATQYSLNQDSEQTGSIDPNGHQSTTNYDKLGNALVSYDGNQNGSFSGFNADSQQTGSGQATGASTQQVYNALGAVIQLTDPDGNITRSLFDQDGNLVATIDPLGHTSYVSYNANNQPVKQVDRDGRAINTNYDNAGRLTSQTWVAADGQTQLNSVSYGYDPAGNLTSAGNNYGSYTFTVDPANRITRQVDPFNLSLQYSYDANANITSVTDSLNGTISSYYDQDSRLTSRRFSDTSSHQLRMDLTYTPDSQIGTETRYSDTAGTQNVGSTANSYDPAGNPTQIVHQNASSSTLLKFVYSYDNANRLSSETDTVNGTPTTTNYGYDAANELTSAGSSTYSFDANGNRTMTGYSTGTGNELSTDGTWNFTYDSEGNLIQKVGISNSTKWLYTYENANHLLVASQYTQSGGVWSLSQTVTHQYDVFGNRVEEDDYTASTGTTTVTKFAYDVVSLSGKPPAPGSIPYGGANAWADLNSSSQLQMRRFWLNAVDALFARMDSTGNDAWDLSDHLGSVRGLQNNSGSLIDQINYDAWGNVTTESSPSSGDRYKFDGGEYSSISGLYHYGARIYDPADGRWTTQDPLGLQKGPNVYCYVTNSPTVLTDSSGLFAWTFSTHGKTHIVSLQMTISYNWINSPPPLNQDVLNSSWAAWAQMAWQKTKAGATTYIDNWTSDREKQFSRKSKERIEEGWNGKAYIEALTKDGTWEGWTPEVRVTIVPTNGDYLIDALANSTPFSIPSETKPQLEGPQPGIVGHWDEDDIRPAPTDKDYKQNVVAHEFGHLIGLADEYYDRGADKKRLMANGNKMVVDYYKRWVDALYAHKPYQQINIKITG